MYYRLPLIHFETCGTSGNFQKQEIYQDFFTQNHKYQPAVITVIKVSRIQTPGAMNVSREPNAALLNSMSLWTKSSSHLLGSFVHLFLHGMIITTLALK